LRRHGRAIKALHPSNYDPNQPRVPKSNPDGGEWTRVAGDPPSNLPEIPQKEPPTRKESNRVVKEVARGLAKRAGSIGKLITVGSWLYERYPDILAYSDPPKTLEELQRAVSKTATPGYEDHHIVEQTSAENDGFPRSMIDGPENLVRIPRLKHWEISGWYGRPNESYGTLSPREYLRGKDWNTRHEVGRDALIRHGVMKP
jgi:hypothetical protein